ncbi:hypothetical protein BJY01DRAFT_209982 [Aspergillus pseudoustus]|uniref:Granulins domain-containing protein n=1 Tax=Aspergillus pseudoustus TaxID=1810923 RepID=A0ABR4KDD1_9EURO
MSATNFGWVLRKNGSCLPSEVDCGETVVPYRVCCPHGSFCPHARNVACCPSKEFCTDTLNGQPHCATPPGVCISTVDTFAANRVPLPMLWMGGRMAVGSPVTSCRQEGSPLSVISAAPSKS